MMPHKKPVNCFGDGNCLFRAVSIILFGNEENHTELHMWSVLELASPTMQKPPTTKPQPPTAKPLPSTTKPLSSTSTSPPSTVKPPPSTSKPLPSTTPLPQPPAMPQALTSTPILFDEKPKKVGQGMARYHSGFRKGMDQRVELHCGIKRPTQLPLCKMQW